MSEKIDLPSIGEFYQHIEQTWPIDPATFGIILLIAIVGTTVLGKVLDIVIGPLVLGVAVIAGLAALGFQFGIVG
jgi:hypothetical protein